MPTTPPPPSRRGPSAGDLLNGVGLLPDGPVLWGTPTRTARPGVFVVELPAPLPTAPIDHAALRRWLERAPGLRLDGRVPTPHELAARLAAYWIPDHTVLFVGSSAKTVGGRIAALYGTEIGDRRPFGSAYRLRTLRDVGKLRVWWAATDASEEYADAVLEAFAAAVEPSSASRLPDPALVLPFGNTETADGRREAHGMTGVFRPDEDAAAGAVAPAAPAGGAPAGRLTRGPARAAASPGSAARSATGRPAEHRTGGKMPGMAPAGGASGQAPAPTHLTGVGLAALRAELEELTTLRRHEIVARIKEARELSDLRENADYESARREQSFLEGRVAQIESMLRDVVVIEDVERTHVAGIGSTVVVEHDGVEEAYTIVGPAEARPAERRISDTSPLGRALVGVVAGADVTVKAPSGDRHFRVLEVR